MSVCCLVLCQARRIKLFERGAKYDDGGAAIDGRFILSLRTTVCRNPHHHCTPRRCIEEILAAS
jgi:hypothetical protein